MAETVCESTNGCICLLCGIPGSGKSHFMERIKEYFTSNVESLAAYFVQFDEIVSFEKQRHLLSEEKGFKRSRQSFVNGCKLFLSYLIDGRKITQQIIDEETQRIVELILNSNKNIEKHRFVLFVEDNFYLRSMRYEFLKLAKQFSLGFVQLMFETSFHVCLSRNAIRANRVPEEFIVKMNDVFEKANTEKYKWESNSLCVQGTDIELKNICDLIKEAMNNPFTEAFDDTEDRQRNQRINNDNLMHQFDCFLRRIVREEIKQSKDCEKRHKAEQLTQRKAQLLRRTLDLPDWFTNEILGKNGFENVNCQIYVRKLLYSEDQDK